ncbi:hypothetical protein HK104_000801 [Borealophlyctis nickersoniae]|nr:hypothetical protein HK104_000801 [Borealophlyctis nickersoniae]
MPKRKPRFSLDALLSDKKKTEERKSRYAEMDAMMSRKDKEEEKNAPTDRNEVAAKLVSEEFREKIAGFLDTQQEEVEPIYVMFEDVKTLGTAIIKDFLAALGCSSRVLESNDARVPKAEEFLLESSRGVGEIADTGDDDKAGGDLPMLPMPSLRSLFTALALIAHKGPLDGRFFLEIAPILIKLCVDNRTNLCIKYLSDALEALFNSINDSEWPAAAAQFCADVANFAHCSVTCQVRILRVLRWDGKRSGATRRWMAWWWLCNRSREGKPEAQAQIGDFDVLKAVPFIDLLSAIRGDPLYRRNTDYKALRDAVRILHVALGDAEQIKQQPVSVRADVEPLFQ